MTVIFTYTADSPDFCAGCHRIIATGDVAVKTHEDGYRYHETCWQAHPLANLKETL